MEVKTTNTYSIFNKVIGNRELDKNNLQRIKNSINEIGLQMPILVNKTNSIIDGQHRLQAAKELKIPVTYIISRDTAEDNIDQLQISKKWTALDFCNKNALKGDKDCKRALSIANKWFIETGKKFSKINAITLLHDGKGIGSTIKNLRNNTYKIDIIKAERIYQCLGILNYNNSIKFNPYTAVTVRALKRIDTAVGGLAFPIIEKITKKHYLVCYSNETDQFNYLRDLYKKYNK
jgi:hypothetical protein